MNWVKVQNRAARFITRNYIREEGRMTGIIEQLNILMGKHQAEKKG